MWGTPQATADATAGCSLVMDEANTDPMPSTIVEEVTVESTDPAIAECATDCNDGQKVSFRL